MTTAGVCKQGGQQRAALFPVKGCFPGQFWQRRGCKVTQSPWRDKCSTLCHEAMPLYGLSKVVPFFRVARTKQSKQEELQINVDREAIFSVVKDVMGRRPEMLRSS